MVNAAGVYSDTLHNWACEEKLSITPRKGESCLLGQDRRGPCEPDHLPAAGKYGKGVLVSPTIHGNLWWAPPPWTTPTGRAPPPPAAGIADLTEKAALSVKNVPMRQVITSFMGCGAHEAGDDFVLGETAECFFDAAGIESRG